MTTSRDATAPPPDGAAAPRVDEDRLARARALLAPCNLCELRCGVDRVAGERGRCGLADETVVYGRMLHFGEEHDLVPSYVVSLSGCSMHCTFCSEDRHLRPPFAGAPTSARALAEALASELPRLRPRARNINFVGGEPSISLPFLLETAFHLERLYPEHPPLLLNTNGLLTPEALALCRDVFDIYVVDLKFGPGDEGWRIGKVPDYFETVTARLLEIAAMRPAPALYVRHLLMPGHVACCTAPVLTWLETHLPQARVNLMPGFVAFSGTRAARHWPTALSRDEIDSARQLLLNSRLEHRLWNGGPLVA